MTEGRIKPEAQLDLGFVRRGGRTIIDRRLFSWPYVITRTFWLDRRPADMLTVILQTSSGAIHGEDTLVQRIEIGENASAHLTTQGAAAVHRAPGKQASEATFIDVGEGGLLEYMPEPRILFPDAFLVQTIDINCAASGTAVISDAFTVHDPLGQDRSFRNFQSTTRLRIAGGELAFIDRLDIAGLSAVHRTRYIAYGSVYLIFAEAEPEMDRRALEITSTLQAISGLYAAASVLPGHTGIGVKLAGEDLRALRLGMEAVWIAFRLYRHGERPPSRRKES